MNRIQLPRQNILERAQSENSQPGVARVNSDVSFSWFMVLFNPRLFLDEEALESRSKEQRFPVDRI